MAKLELISTGRSFNNYYLSLNNTMHKGFNKYMMLHYPFYKQPGEGLEERQLNLTDFCVEQIETLKEKKLLEVGCGNGLQSIYIANKWKPSETIGIDLIEENIALARSHEHNGSKVNFLVDDAHKLDQIPDNSIDTAICIESAFHYPNKDLFLQQMNRVLKPGGEFVIADILSRSEKKRYLLGKWKRKMNYYHWTMDQYHNSFKGKNLYIEKTHNITPKIIKGYTGYMSWVNSKDCSSYLRYLFLQVFMFIQVNLNLVLLKRRRHYMIFKGRKLAA